MGEHVNQFTADIPVEGMAGHQSSQAWSAGSAGQGLTLLTGRQLNPARAYRITVTGKNVLLTIRTGTSDTTKTERVVPPARFNAFGNVVVTATVEDDDYEADARVMVGYANAGEVPDVAGVEDATVAPVVLQPQAVAFRALVASALTIRGVAVSLLPGQAVELRAPATLTSGAGTVQYEP